MVVLLHGPIYLDVCTELTFQVIHLVENVQSVFLFNMAEIGSGKTQMQSKENKDFSEESLNLIGRGQGSMRVLPGSKQIFMQKVHQQ